MTKKGESLRLYPKPEPGLVLMMLLEGFGGTVMLLASLGFSRDRMTALGMLAVVVVSFWWAYTYSRPGRLYLELTPEGFAERNPLRTRRFRWQDIESFFVRTLDGDRVVAFRLSGAYRGRHPPRVFRDYDDILRLVYDPPPEDLAELMESWRRHGAKAAAISDLMDDAL